MLQLTGGPEDVLIGRSRKEIVTYSRNSFSITSQIKLLFHYIDVSLLLQASAKPWTSTK